MKVVLINAVYKSGSTGKLVYEMHQTMRKQGIESYVATAQKDQLDKYCYQIGNPLDWKLHALLSRISGLQGYFSDYATKNLISWLKEIKPDVVQLHNLHANYMNLNLLFRYLAKEKIVTMIILHDCWFFTGKCMHYKSIQCNKWKTGCNHCPKLHLDNVSWFFDRTEKMWSDKKKRYNALPHLVVVGVSDWIASEAKMSILNTAECITRIYNWINLSLFSPKSSLEQKKVREKLGVKHKYVILGVAGGWEGRKGLSSFIELSKQLQQDEIIILVGKMKKGINLPKNIISIPATSNQEELVQYYSIADVFLQLSKEETFGMVVAEALACGTPVITNDSTANKELVNRECGIVLENISTSQLKKAIQEIRKNGKSRYSVACRKFATENFSMEKQVNEYVKLCKKCLTRDRER